MGDITPDDYEKWEHPRDAFNRVAEAVGSASDAATLLFGALRDGILASVADVAVSGQARADLVQISISDWRTLKYIVSSASFWSTGYITITHTDHRYVERPTSFHGVRFNPRHVTKLIGAPAAPGASPPPAARADRKGWPQPAPAHLAAWFRVFRDAYPQGGEEAAMTSAEGMFPDKWIVRDRVRELLGPRPMGRPGKTKKD